MKSARKLKLEELGRIDVETFKNSAKLPITIVVDNFRSGLNIGSVFRTCDAFRIEKVILCGISSTPPHKEILKTAIGANEAVEWSYEKEVSSPLIDLKAKGYEIIGVEQTTQSIPLHDFEVNTQAKYAIVMGNEVEGISQEILPIVTTFLEIPQFGTKHSLNVSVCAGIIIYEFAKEFRII